MRAALRTAVHVLPPGDNGPMSGSIYAALPLPERLADLTARAKVDAPAASCGGCLHRIELLVAAAVADSPAIRRTTWRGCSAAPDSPYL